MHTILLENQCSWLPSAVFKYIKKQHQLVAKLSFWAEREEIARLMHISV